MIRKQASIIEAHIKKKEITILIGARQVGKTTMLKQFHANLLSQNISSFFLSFEQQDILAAINEHPENLFKYVPFNKTNKTLSFNKKTYVFIDEVQYAANPSNFLKYLFDAYGDGLKIIATGSSAFYLDKNIKDSLAGRKRIFEIYTLDFEEYLQFAKQELLIPDYLLLKKNKQYVSLNDIVIRKHFADFLLYGGYPAVTLQKNKSEKILQLKELVSSYLKKDFYESGLTDEIKFYNLLKILANQTGNLLNRHEVCNTLGIRAEKLEEYLYVLQKSFHIQLIKPMYGNLRKELSKMPKVYFNDAGFRNAILNNFQPIDERLDKGQIIENSVFEALRNRYGIDEIKYWRTADGNEVDFIVEGVNNLRLAYEVKFNDTEFKQSKYKKFVETYPDFKLNYISYSGKNEILRF